MLAGQAGSLCLDVGSDGDGGRVILHWREIAPRRHGLEGALERHVGGAIDVAKGVTRVGTRKDSGRHCKAKEREVGK